ncbi:acid sphingomyelinase-like phosphodiesterase 3b [Sitophilus oryzae]|uniref:Acid sphingomyelinase-like phosphodiesterase 3b n=1 Tax=Sitophilus oryzae TaxID=7048 RepID=A0A6J2Y0W4_SITOR|nr:acid sphingomyelinase-like phosphodiesterase 3b [Sitophilus oryzae]
MMMTRQNDNVEFVLWTGDALSHHATKHVKEGRLLEIIQNVTDLLRKTFSSQFVFPALGHDDPLARRELGRLWRQWLPTDAMTTFETGGYYLIERKSLKLQVIVLNTNLMRRPEDDEDATAQWVWLEKKLTEMKNKTVSGYYLIERKSLKLQVIVLNTNLMRRQEDDEDATAQWVWLEKKLTEMKNKTVYLVGHIPPGSDERHKGLSASSHIMYKDFHNKKYLKIVRKFHSIIVGQFFGHLHSDTFRIVYAENGRPISWAMLAPSITPKRTHNGPNNPGLRIYKFDKDTGQVFDYTQYYLDLSSANYNRKADWVVEYNFSTYYGINDITPLNLHTLADKFTQEATTDNGVFNKYYKANSVKIHTRATTNCDDTCAHTHYCAITRIDYDEHSQCLKIAASALSSSSSFTISCAKFKIILAAVFVSVVRYVLSSELFD